MDAAGSRVLSQRDRILIILVPVVLVIVASVQVARVRALDQSAWEGGGFGMFATYDSAPNRLVRITGPAGEVIVPDPDLAEQARIVPSEGNLRRLAREAAENGDAPVTVEVWRFDLRAVEEGLRFEVEQIRRLELVGSHP